MRKFLIKITLITLPVLFAVIGVNYYVDPVGLFSDNDLEIRAVKIIRSGHNVAGLSNYDERFYQKIVIDSLEQSPTTIVLGSSRGMLIDRANANDSTLINSCVSGASFDDILAIYQLYRQRAYEPKRVIIEISAYMFNDQYNDQRYKTIAKQYNKFASELGLDGKFTTSNISTVKWLEIVSLSYFQNSLRSIGTSPDSIFAFSGSIHPTQTVKFADGTFAYSTQYEERKVSQKDIIEAIEYGEGLKFLNISTQQQHVFETFISYLTGCNVDVLLFLAPAPDPVRSKQKMLDHVQKYIESFASKHPNISLVGSYKSEDYGLTIDDFYDGLHPKKYVYDMMLK